MPEQLKALVGGRVLILDKKARHYSNDSVVSERRVMELSPSGQWVKLMNGHGLKYWVKSAELQVVEVLNLATTEAHPEAGT